MKVSTRNIKEMVDMYELPQELYTMKRGVKRKGKLRYDITIIPPYVINGHHNKTHGHIHTTGHKELYEVRKGSAYFIIQYPKEVKIVFAQKGKKILLPGDCYHNTTNASTTETLELGNWIDNCCKSDYSLMAKKKGMMYYLTTKGWIANKNYKSGYKILYEVL